MCIRDRICGAYGRGNAGDDAILEAILQEMRSIDPDTVSYTHLGCPSGSHRQSGQDGNPAQRPYHRPAAGAPGAVSYTHLDVYKRQLLTLRGKVFRAEFTYKE